MTKADGVEALATRSTVKMVAEGLVEPRFVCYLRSVRPPAPHRKLPFDESNDLPMKRPDIQHLGIRDADGRSGAWFVGDHPVVSKAHRPEVSQRFIRIAERDGAQPVAQAIRLDEEDKRPVENAQDAHGRQ